MYFLSGKDKMAGKKKGRWEKKERKKGRMERRMEAVKQGRQGSEKNVLL